MNYIYPHSGILSDSDIKYIQSNSMDSSPFIHPFQVEQSRISGTGLLDRGISSGLTSMGYDARLADEVKIVRKMTYLDRIKSFFMGKDLAVDPKAFDVQVMDTLEVHHGEDGFYVVLPPKAFALGYTMETFDMPSNVLGQCLGKSTLARSGISLIVTPLEPGWSGQVTLEIYNSLPRPVKLYVREGICQFNFFASKFGCDVTYSDRSGKYQDQEGITTSRI